MGIMKQFEPSGEFLRTKSIFTHLHVTDKMALSSHGVRMFFQGEGYIDTGREMRGWGGDAALSGLNRAR